MEFRILKLLIKMKENLKFNSLATFKEVTKLYMVSGGLIDPAIYFMNWFIQFVVGS